MHRFLENMAPHHYEVVRQAAHQIAGRKPKRKHYNFNIPREKQHRARYSPFKDIADASQEQMIQIMRDQGVKRMQGGGLFSAFEDVVSTIHNEVRNATETAAEKVGLGKLKDTLDNVAGTAGVQIDIGADDFLHRVGLRHHGKYQSADVDDNLKAHALLHKDAYLKLNDRKGTDRYTYLKNKSTDKYATYLDTANEGKVVMAFRGTDPKDALHNNDLVEDVNIAAGNVNAISEFDDYKNTIANLLEEYGDGNVSLSGYSLGGGKAVALTQDKDLRSRLGTTMALAPGMTATDPHLREKAHDTKIQYYYKHSDMVANSLLSHGGSNHHVWYDEMNPLKAHLALDSWA